MLRSIMRYPVREEDLHHRIHCAQRAARTLALLLIIVFVLFPGLAGAEGELRFAELGDLVLENGQTIKDCRIGYRTFGRLNSGRTNAVLFPTWLAGTSEELVSLGFIGPGKLADTDRYFVIAVDALGNGVSSSPSRSDKRSGPAFPDFSIRDLVKTQHILLTRDLQLAGIHAVVGISMGGMQAFEWMSSYPGFVHKVVPIEASPRLTTGDLLFFTAELRIIEGAKDHPGGEDRSRKALTAIHAYGSRNPSYYHRNVPPEEFPALLADTEKAFAQYDLDDWALQLKAMMGQNVSLPPPDGKAGKTRFGRSKLFVIVARDDLLVNPEPSLMFARATGGKTMELTGGCGHLSFLCEADRIREAVAAFLSED